MRIRMYRYGIKRALDIIFSLLAIVILFPVCFIIAGIIYFTMGTPIIFSQERIGKDEKIFLLYKFRSMTDARDKDGNLLDEDQRISKVGAVLRSLSLDELPELFCILKGDMSFVGPRPLPAYYGPYFLADERRRHKVRGGLIPPDSLSGKAYTSYEEQFQYEVDYVDHVSFLLDIKIIVATFCILFRRAQTGYGDYLNRPHLNIYRKDMKINEFSEGKNGDHIGSE